MEIFFGYKSAELTDLAKDYLKPVGEAMASEKLQNLDFVVEGHTDAVGGYAYNLNLSEERAASVKRFLVDTFHIEPYRIQIIGKGKSDLLDPKSPESEVNRRVKIIAKK
jgi:outer membrane protein OmpA-like peptidoglycan-associated protein